MMRRLPLPIYDEAHLFDLLSMTDRLRRTFKGDEVNLCSIVNAKSGSCAEDCTFCSQSVKYETDAPSFPLLDSDSLIRPPLRPRPPERASSLSSRAARG